MNIQLLQELLVIAICSGAIMTLFIQKIKEGFKFKDSKTIICLSFILNLVIGTLFALNFSDVTWVNALWCGLFSFIGADLVYKTLEEKVFVPFNKIKEKEEEIEYDL